MRTRARRKLCGPATSSAATARAAPCAGRSGGRCRATRPTMPGASWTCWRSRTSPISGSRRLIQSAGEGSIIIIPREGGYLVRIYVELDKLKEDERVASRNITVDRLIAATQRIFRPYAFEVKEVAWWSVYEIGQRLCDKFDDVPAERGGDAAAARVHRRRCLPHAQPEGGPGHERLHAGRVQSRLEAGVGAARAVRAELLHTYSAERQAIAKELIDFDREWAQMLSGRTSPAIRRRRRRPGEGPGLLRQARALHGGNGDPIQAVAHLRRAGASAPGQGLADRHALPFRAGHPPGGCQADGAGPRGRRPMAAGACSPSPARRTLRRRHRACGRCAISSPSRRSLPCGGTRPTARTSTR